MADPLVGRLSQVLFDLVLFPLWILNLLWLAPVLAIWRRVWFSIKPTRQVRGKVVVITGASSGIGKHIAYEFAKRGAKLVIAARRVELLEKVAENCRLFGSPDVVVVQADVQKESDCKALIHRAIKHFEILDILVNNAGVAHSFLASDAPDFSLDTAQEVINTTMWGQVYPTYYALPHLKATKGQLLNIISVASYIPYPRQAFYNAAKHAAIGFFDTLRAEIGDAVTITNILPGWTVSEMTEGKLLDRGDAPAWDTDLRDEHVGPWPVLPTQILARKAVQSALKHERNVIVPYWYNLFLFYRVFAPEVLDWSFKSLFFGKEKGKSSPMKKVVQLAGHEAFNYPEPGAQKESTEHKEET